MASCRDYGKQHLNAVLTFVKSNKADKFWAIEWFENERGCSIFHPSGPLTVFSFEAFQSGVWEFVNKHFEACRYRRVDLKMHIPPDKKELRRALENDVAAEMGTFWRGGYVLQRVYYPRPNLLAMERAKPRFHLKTLDDGEFMKALRKVLDF